MQWRRLPCRWPPESTFKKLVSASMLLEVIRDGRAFRPVSGDREKKASQFFIKKSGKTIWLALFNMENTSMKFVADLQRLGLIKNERYLASSAGLDSTGTTTSTFPFHQDQIFTIKAGSAMLLKISNN